MKQMQDHERYAAIWNSELPPLEKLLLLAINSYGNFEQAYPAVGTLAEKLGCSIRTIKRLKQRLASKGTLKLLKRYTPLGDRDTDIYVIEFSYFSTEGGVVTGCHYGGDRESLGVVTESHPSVPCSVPIESLPKKVSLPRAPRKENPFDFFSTPTLEENLFGSHKQAFKPDLKKLQAQLAEDEDPWG